MCDKIKEILQHEEFIARAKQIGEYEKDRVFCRHDLQHFMDTARITYILILEKGEQEVLFPGREAAEVKTIIYATALLHDLGRVEQYRDGIDHALTSGRIAGKILKEIHFPPELINQMCLAIAEHREYHEKNSLFGKRLYQGDKLSRRCHGCESFTACKIEREYKEGKEIY